MTREAFMFLCLRLQNLFQRGFRVAFNTEPDNIDVIQIAVPFDPDDLDLAADYFEAAHGDAALSRGRVRVVFDN